MTEKLVKVAIPGHGYIEDSRASELWAMMQGVMRGAAQELGAETTVSVILSVVAQKLRDDCGAEFARQVFQGFADGMLLAGQLDAAPEVTPRMQ